MMDTTFYDGSYLSRSWRMLTQDKGWYKPILVLALVTFVPIVGLLGTLGYYLGWARLTAWGIDSAPKQRKVDVGACIVGGWKGFVVELVWGIVGGIIAGFVVALSGAWLLWLVWFGIALYSIVLDVAVVRSAIYQHIGPGFGLSQIFDMCGRDFGGIMKIFLILLLRVAVTFAFTLVILLIVSLALAGPLAQVGTLYYYSGNSDFLLSNGVSLVTGIISWLGPLVVVCAYLESLIGATFDLLIFNSVALWMRQFNVPAWGGPADPVPPSIPSTPMPIPGAWAGPTGPTNPTTWANPPQAHGSDPWKGASPMNTPQTPSTPPERNVAPAQGPAGTPQPGEAAPSSPEYVGEPVVPPTPEDLYDDATKSTTKWTDVVSPTPDATFHMAWPADGATKEPERTDEHGVRPPSAPELYTEVAGGVARTWPDIDLQTQDAVSQLDTPEMADAVNEDIDDAARELGVEPPAPEVAAVRPHEAPAVEVPQTPVTPPEPKDLYGTATAATTRWTEVVTPPEPGTGHLGAPKIVESVKFPDDVESESEAEPGEREIYGQVTAEVAKTWPDIDLRSEDAVASIDSPEVKEAVDEAIAEQGGDDDGEHVDHLI